MIMCPFCGHQLPKAVKDGITTCSHCARISDSTPFNRILSAGWLVRRQHIYDENRLLTFGFDIAEAELAIQLVAEMCYSHDELIEALEKLNISKVYVTDLE